MKQLHEGLLVAGQISANDFPKLIELGVTDIINNRPDGEEPGQLTAAEAQELAAKHGLKYHFLPMANGQPLPDGTVEEFKAVLKQSEGAVLAHCRSGMRSSFIWALGAIADSEVTVDEAISAAQSAGIPLQNARAVLEAVQP